MTEVLQEINYLRSCLYRKQILVNNFKGIQTKNKTASFHPEIHVPAYKEHISLLRFKTINFIIINELIHPDKFLLHLHLTQ